MKKGILMFALWASILSSGFAITHYQAGDRLYVLASSGLTLREKPSADGARITVLEHGSSVIVAPEDLKKHAYAVTEFKGFTINGYWVSVKTPDNKTGYVFDGYLSKYQAPAVVVDPAQLGGGNALVELYMLAHTAKKGDRTDLAKSETEYTKYKQQFANTAEVEVVMAEGGGFQAIVFDKYTSMEEAYLIGKALWLKQKPAVSKVENGQIMLEDADEETFVSVSNRNGLIYLHMSYAD